MIIECHIDAVYVQLIIIIMNVVNTELIKAVKIDMNNKINKNTLQHKPHTINFYTWPIYTKLICTNQR
jgi:hypothetical protein